MALKNLIFLLSLMLANNTALNAQTNKDYTAEWKQVEAFEKKGLTRSALDQVMKIFNAAISTGNEAQQVKGAMYQMKYRNMVEEDNKENNIFYLDTLIAKVKAPAKNILQSMQAELLWTYKKNNRYRFYNRTALQTSVAEAATDVATWSLEKLNETSTRLYKASLQNNKILRSASLAGFDAILSKEQNTAALRPTLYDLLAHRALDYFKSTENDITDPSYHFILSDEKLFAPAEVFADASFQTKDTGSLYYNAVILLQDLTRFHLQDAKPDALLDVNLERLSFINEQGIFSNKKALYEESLVQLERRYATSPLAAQAMLLRAGLYLHSGEDYDLLTNPTARFDLKKAVDLFNEIIQKYGGTQQALNAKNQLNGILQPNLRLSAEKVNLINTAFRTLVTYKNVGTLYLRILKTSREELNLITKGGYDERWSNILKLKSIRSWRQALPDAKDFQEHAVEIKIDALPAGTYIILASVTPDFSLQNNFLVSQQTIVSNISMISNDNSFYMLDRNTGTPLINAEVQLWKNAYDYTSRKYKETKLGKYLTDKNGFLKTPYTDSRDNYAYYLQVKYKHDELYTDDNYYAYSNNGYAAKETRQTFLFTDRSIYRPGQTVFFKGIMVKTTGGKKPGIVAGQQTYVQLLDVNDQKIQTVRLTTNEYGSFHGSFTLPEGLLNGAFRIVDSITNSRHDINVEEYKRPTFSVDIKKPEGSYRINDSITITGNAKAYAGNNITGAQVKYRVVRKTRYPVWFGYSFLKRYFPPGNTEQMEITNGITVSGEEGSFTIKFKAIPDETVDKKDQPVFYYEVSADITDQGGETRSGSISVGVAYHSLQLSIDVPANISSDSLKNIRINSTNTNDLFEKATVHLTIEKLQEPGKIFRKRYWDRADQFVMTKEEYGINFPYDAYADEDDMSKWPVEKKTADINDTTKADGWFNISVQQAATGWYKITAHTKDKYGEDVMAEQYIRISNADKPRTGDALFADVRNNISEPGQEVKYSISTGFDKIWLIRNITRANTGMRTSYDELTKTTSLNDNIKVTEDDRGGIAISYVFVQHNNVYQGTTNIAVPWRNKDLQVSYETFRDKLLPGSEEKWTIRISGNRSDKVAAETLIGMYDASLDQFRQHSWNSLSAVWPLLNTIITWSENSFVMVHSDALNSLQVNYEATKDKFYADLASNGWNEDEVRYMRFNSRAEVSAAPQATRQKFTPAKACSFKQADKEGRIEELKDDVANEPQNATKPAGVSNIQVRKNFNETAFFFPDLTTDANGNISFSFTIPEALTTWKMMTLAHTKELASVYSEKTVVTQKPLMVQPNAPRFLREGDELEFSARVVNLSGAEITGTATLELFDAATNKPVDGWTKNVFPNQYFTVAAGQTVSVKFPFGMPVNFNSALQYRIKAISKDGSFSDGEEAAFPVLSNRMLVTETLPLNMRNTSLKTFRFEKLLHSDTSSSLSNHAITVEYSSNPAWYAVQALPYLMAFPYECAEQNFNRYYANVLASFISNSTPKIRAVFDRWNILDTAALMSNLQKNESLKAALLQETPWVLEAKSEREQKKDIGILFDMIRLAKEKTNSLNKLKEMQSSNGGFTWFKGGPDDRFITQYIITGIGHLRKLNALSAADYAAVKPMVDKALPYLDARIKEDYQELIKRKTAMSKNNLDYHAIQYLYMRSFFPETKVNAAAQTSYNYYRGQSMKHWLTNNKYMQAMIALSLNRTGDLKTPGAIIKSLKQNAIYKEDMGMYFKEFTTGGYYWYQAPIESQALIIEAFSDIEKNDATVNDLKTWLLKQKQTQNWRTTKATADACYALLLNGSNWLAEEKDIRITLGNTAISSTDVRPEAGTGYFKQTIAGDRVEPAMGNITIAVSGPAAQSSDRTSLTSYGAVYWQYFEQLDKITTAGTPLRLSKKLFIEKNSDKGPAPVAVNDGDALHVGDKIKVRIELRADREMEYVHMKDMRAACMEPTNVISSYRYQDGLGYYETTKDASTNFFFSRLPKGTYIFEYSMFVTLGGNYSNGITTIQCMYAPEFSSHSEGIRVNVE